MSDNGKGKDDRDDRDNAGKFVKGNASKGGRPPGFRGLAKEIRAATNDGRDLVDFALDVMRDEKNATRDRLAAHHWLSDRAWGKAPAVIEITGGPLRVDLSKLTDEELAAYEALCAKVSAAAVAELAAPDDDDDADPNAP